MQNYIVYSELTGAIIKSGQCHDDDVGIQPDYSMSQNVLVTVEDFQNDSTHYVDLSGTPTVTAKPSLLTVATDWSTLQINNTGIDTATLGAGDLPFGTTISIVPPKVTDATMDQLPIPDPIILTDGIFEFDSTYPGNYSITATIFPFADYTRTINVVDLNEQT